MGDDATGKATNSEKNWNSPRPVADQSAKDAHREMIRLVQTPDHPSTLTLPLGDASSPCKTSAAWCNHPSRLFCGIKDD